MSFRSLATTAALTVSALAPLGALAPAALAADPKPAAAPAKDTALVELVEFGDYQCPFSARARATVEELRSTYGDKLTFRWAELPLAFHERARPAAIAAEAARRQGKLEAFHELLFANQHVLDDAAIRTYAQKAGLDVKRFDKDLSDPALAAIVDRDVAVAGAIGATGTPTFFVNGEVLMGAQPIEKFKALIDAEIAAAAGGSGGPAWRAERAARHEAFARYFVKGETPPDKPVAQPTHEDGPTPTAAAGIVGPPVAVDASRAPLIGDAQAPTEVIVFADLQCPFSARAVPMLEGLAQRKAGHWALRWMNLPLAFHPKAEPAAEAVACAAEQGKAWALVDAIYADQRSLTDDKLSVLEKKAGLDVKKVAACVAAGRGKAVVEADLKAAGAAHVQATPTILVNGLRVTNWTAPDLEAQIDAVADGRRKPDAP